MIDTMFARQQTICKELFFTVYTQSYSSPPNPSAFNERVETCLYIHCVHRASHQAERNK